MFWCLQDFFHTYETKATASISISSVLIIHLFHTFSLLLQVKEDWTTLSFSNKTTPLIIMWTSSRHDRKWHLGDILASRIAWYESDPPENCHLNVNSLPNTWHFFQKNWQKLSFFQQNCQWQFCWKKWLFLSILLKKMSSFWQFVDI